MLTASVAESPGASMRYERPKIVRREPIAGLLVAAKTDKDATPSDADLKENVVPVLWGTRYGEGHDDPATDRAYETPSIVRRERIDGLLAAVKTDGDIGISDLDRKENIVPVLWGTRYGEGHDDPATDRAYETPSVVRRDRIEGLLRPIKTDGDTDFSDVNLKENFAPVAW
jgi:hypothetical protein